MTALGELIAEHQDSWFGRCDCGWLPENADEMLTPQLNQAHAEHVADEIRKWRFQRPVITHANIDDIHDYCGEEDQEPA